MLAERPSYLAPDTVDLPLAAGAADPMSSKQAATPIVSSAGTQPALQPELSINSVWEAVGQPGATGGLDIQSSMEKQGVNEPAARGATQSQKHASNHCPDQAPKSAGRGDVSSTEYASKAHAILNDAADESQGTESTQRGASAQDEHSCNTEGTSRAQGTAAMCEVGRKLNSGRGTGAKTPALPPVAEGTEGSLGSGMGSSLMSNILTGSVEKRLPVVQGPDAIQQIQAQQQTQSAGNTEVSERAHSISYQFNRIACSMLLCSC